MPLPQSRLRNIVQLAHLALRHLKENVMPRSERSDDGRAASAAAESWIETDPQTGRTSLKLPAPAPETLQRLAGALGALLAGLRQR